MKPQKIDYYMTPDSCSRVALTALEEIGCDYEVHIIAIMAGEHRRPDYLAMNPNGNVPTLVVDGVALSQNFAILYYLNDVFPEAKLLPQANTPMERWEQNALFSTLLSDLHFMVPFLRFPAVFTSHEAAHEEMGQRAADTMRLKLGALNERLSNREWMMGKNWSILDAYISWVWFRTKGLLIPAEEFPAIEDVFQRHHARPSAIRAAKIEAAENIKLEARGLIHHAKP